jgi:hypothetical protein
MSPGGFCIPPVGMIGEEKAGPAKSAGAEGSEKGELATVTARLDKPNSTPDGGVFIDGS